MKFCFEMPYGLEIASQYNISVGYIFILHIFHYVIYVKYGSVGSKYTDQQTHLKWRILIPK